MKTLDSSSCEFMKTSINRQASRPITVAAIGGVNNDRDGNAMSRLRKALPRSVRTLAGLLRNVSLAALWTAIAILCGSLGNFTTGKTVDRQSRAEFLSTTMFWTQVMFCGFNVATQAAFLIRQRFLDRPGEPAGYLICLKRVFKATYIVNIIDISFPVGVIFVLSVITNDSSCSLRWTYSINCGAAIVYMTMLAIAVRRIFHETTIAGTQQQSKRTSSDSTSDRLYKNRRRHFFKIMTAIMPTSQRDLAIFAIASIVLKLGIQELVKMGTVKRQVKEISTMLLVVAVPTVLIDTQVRVMLQLANNVSTSVGGSIAMAFLEIAMRTGKTLYLRAQINRKSRQLYGSMASDGVATIATIHPTSGAKLAQSESAHPRSDSIQSFSLWKTQVLRFHAAEAYADMAAEYMALGASTLIVTVYDNHPMYQLGQWIPSSNTADTNKSTRYFLLLAFQVALELFVDAVSCTVETAYGVNFDELRKYESFVTACLIAIAIMNVQITSVMYLKCECSIQRQ